MSATAPLIDNETITHPSGWPAPIERHRPRLVVIQGGGRPPTHDRHPLLAAAALGVLGVVLVLGIGLGFAWIDSTSQPVATLVTPDRSLSSTADGDVIIVQAGDTLTSIARSLRPDGDTTRLVEILASRHGPGPLQAGDRLDVAGLASSN